MRRAARWRRVAAAAGASTALAATGCGSDPEAGPDQEDRFRVVYAGKSAKIEAIGSDIATALGRAGDLSDTQITKTFGDLARRARTTADELQALDTPDEAAAPLRTLQRAVDKAAGDLTAITRAATADDPAAARTAAQALVADSAPIRDARAELDRLLER